MNRLGKIWKEIYKKKPSIKYDQNISIKYGKESGRSK